MAGLTPLDVFALTIYGEARNQPVEGRIAVANVIRNRVRTSHWGAGYDAVCLAPHQFSCWQRVGGAANYEAIKALQAQIEQGQRPTDPVLTECYAIAQEIVSGRLQDNTRSSTHYYVTKSPTPLWAVGHAPACYVADHAFFSDVA